MQNLFKKQSAKFVLKSVEFYESYDETHFGVFFMPHSVDALGVSTSEDNIRRAVAKTSISTSLM